MIKDLKFRSMILPDLFIDQDTPEKMYQKAGLDSLSIVDKIEEALNSNIILAKNKIKFLINHTELGASKMIKNYTTNHRFTNRNCSNSDTRIMSSFYRNICILSFFINSFSCC